MFKNLLEYAGHILYLTAGLVCTLGTLIGLMLLLELIFG